MDKKVWEAVNERSEGLCEECGSHHLVTKHHIFGASNRKKLEMPETVYDLCYYHHQQSPSGIHFNKELRDKYKRLATQNLLDKGWSKEKILKEVGRWYLD